MRLALEGKDEVDDQTPINERGVRKMFLTDMIVQ